MELLRLDRCLEKSGYTTHTSIYNNIRNGLWTKPVRIGQRAVAWPDHEIDAICVARTVGYSEAQIRELVDRLHAKRVDMLRNLEAISLPSSPNSRCASGAPPHPTIESCAW